MAIQAMMDFDHTPGEEKVERSPERAPIVTVFGAGIAGLSAAHELAERGFSVHVVEQTRSLTEEYACQIGGMAANQLAQVRLDRSAINKLTYHPDIDILRTSAGIDLAPKKYTLIDDDKADRILLEISKLALQPVRKRFTLTERIVFAQRKSGVVPRYPTSFVEGIKPEFEADFGWKDYIDIYGVKNRDKLQSVYDTLKEAYHLYNKEWRATCAKLSYNIDSHEYNIKLDLSEFCVIVIGYTDDSTTSKESREDSRRWSKHVKRELETINDINNVDPIPRFPARVLSFGLGTEELLGDQFDETNSWRSNRVEIHIAGQRVPGEHGYRFFPSFYRHVFDTMKRTPVFAKNGDLTHETAFDQLVETPDVALGFGDGRGLTSVKLTNFTSLSDVKTLIDFLKNNIALTDLDLLRLQTYFLKYMTSCKKRRQKEADDVSFWEYIGADRVKYSPQASSFLNRTPQALVAMSATETDARTQYNIVIQMLVKNPLEECIPDFTLNASTSDAWLHRWKQYLKRKGVNFYTGHLMALHEKNGEYVPKVGGAIDDRPVPEWDNPDLNRNGAESRQWFDVEQSDFFIMALPFEEASAIVAEAYGSLADPDRKKFTGPFRQLYEFDVVTGRRNSSEAETSRNRKRDPQRGLPTNEKDPLRDISGVQYFTANNYRLGEGHAYYPGSPWALSSISQLAFWRERVKPVGKYVGQMSFDIGDWYSPHAGDYADGSTAWNSTRQEIAECTWLQALKSLDPRRVQFIVHPQYYHLDQGIKFSIASEVREPNPGSDKWTTTTAAFRANAVVKLLSAEDKKIFWLRFDGVPDPIKASGNDPNKICADLANQINDIKINDDKFAIAENTDAADVIISPIVSTDCAVITITGSSEHEFSVFLTKKVYVKGSKDRRKIRDDLLEELKKIPGFRCEELQEMAIKIYSSKASNRNEDSSFQIAVCNKDNCIELIGSPRMTITLGAPELSNGARSAEIPDDVLDHALVIENTNPYIINVPGQWKHRPGIASDTERGHYGPCPGIEYASPTDSLFRRWVPAGTYIATCTRMTTMEAANESGRHAVNAILRTIMETKADTKPVVFNGQGKLIGDFCKIWDPEDHELPDLEPLKALDEALMREGLPHVLDIFRVTDLLESLSEDISQTDALREINRSIEAQCGAGLLGSHTLAEILASQFNALRALLFGGAPNSR